MWRATRHQTLKCNEPVSVGGSIGRKTGEETWERGGRERRGGPNAAVTW